MGVKILYHMVLRKLYKLIVKSIRNGDFQQFRKTVKSIRKFSRKYGIDKLVRLEEKFGITSDLLIDSNKFYEFADNCYDTIKEGLKIKKTSKKVKKVKRSIKEKQEYFLLKMNELQKELMAELIFEEDTSETYSPPAEEVELEICSPTNSNSSMRSASPVLGFIDIADNTRAMKQEALRKKIETKRKNNKIGQQSLDVNTGLTKTIC